MNSRFVARQPIFDKLLKVFGYELLFRSNENNFFRPHPAAANSVIVDATTLFDLDTLVGPARAFVNLDETALLQEAASLLPPDRVVLEILESVTVNEAVVSACGTLVERGYVLALDDFADIAKWEPLLHLATFLKVDFRATDEKTCRAAVKKYAPKGLQMLAEKVETRVQLHEARSQGYAYFQGYFFCKPQMVSTREIPGSKVNYVRLLAAIAAEELDFAAIDGILRQDPSLTYRLLRYLNSPLRGLRAEVHSIRHALSLLGEIEFRRWVSVVAVSAMAGEKPAELVRTALTRAYFCEAVAETADMRTKGPELFLMGLLSVTDALLDRPIESVLQHLPVSKEIRGALTGSSSRYRDVYEVLLAYERGDWTALSAAALRACLDEKRIPECYLGAVSRTTALQI